MLSSEVGLRAGGDLELATTWSPQWQQYGIAANSYKCKKATYLSDWNSLNGSELKLKSVDPRSGVGSLRGADC